MKRRFNLIPVLFFLIIYSPSLLAQYEPFDESAEYHFSRWDAIEDERLPLAFDSVVDFGDYQRYFPFHMIRGSFNGCIQEQKHHWIGDHIDVFSDGTHHITLPSQDIFEIKTNAEEGDRWIAMMLDYGQIEVEVISQSTEMIEGELDSIKVFQFYLLDSNGVEVVDGGFDGIGNISMKLSKNHGYLRTAQFGLWPGTESVISYHGGHFIDVSVRSFDNLFFSEVYDFGIGDQFYVFNIVPDSNLNRNQCHTITTILEKEEQTEKYMYKIVEWERNETRVEEQDTFSVVERIDTIWVEYRKHNANFDKLALIPFVTDSNKVRRNLSFTSYFGRRKVFGSHDFWKIENDTCLEQVTNEIDELDNYFVDGKGGPYYSGFLKGSFYRRSLLHFKNDSIEIGTPYGGFSATNDVDESNSRSRLKIFPNPVSDKLIIGWNEEIEIDQCQIITMQGQLILEIRPTLSSDSQIKINANFIPGMYLCRIISASGDVDTRCFVKL